MYRILSKIYPKSIREGYKNILLYNNIKTAPERFIGFVLVFGLFLGLAIALDFSYLFELPLILTWIALFLLMELIVYLYLWMAVEIKTKFIEKVLPDALQLTASNLRAGLTVDKALLLSTRPEFGPLENELNILGKEVTTGKSIEEALMGMAKRNRSEKLKKAILLINSGLRAGGELALLLEQTSKNIRNQQIIEQRIRSNVLMYVIFIFFAISVGAPILFGLSSYLVETMANIFQSVEIPKTTVASALPINFTQVNVSPDFIFKFALASLISSSIMGGLILGLINKGKEKEGVKYIPILAILSVGIFLLVRYIIQSLLGGLFSL